MAAVLPNTFASQGGVVPASQLDANFQTVGNPASNQTNVASPTAPASTAAFTMQGLAGSITPSVSGSVFIDINGTIVGTSGTAANGIQFQIHYGTGTAPINGAAVTGTALGTITKYLNPTTLTAADIAVPFDCSAVVTGLTVGTAYWIDLAAESLATISVIGLSAVSVTSLELG